MVEPTHLRQQLGELLPLLFERIQISQGTGASLQSEQKDKSGQNNSDKWIHGHEYWTQPGQTFNGLS